MRARGILTEAWGPLGHGRYPVSDIPELQAIGASHGVTPVQVAIRWQLDSGRIVFPKSATPSRIAENFDVFGFALTPAELDTIATLDEGRRVGDDPAEK